MFCPSCGVAVSEAASFCHKCGKEIPQDVIGKPFTNDSRTVFSGLPTAAGKEAPLATGELVKQPTENKPKTWKILAVLFFLYALYFSVLGPAFSGLKNNPRDAIYVLFFGGLCFWWLFKSRGRKGWIGGAVGAFVSLAVLVAGSAITARVQNSPEYLIQHNPNLAALKKHHPHEYDAIEREVKAAADRNASAEEIVSLISSKINPLLSQAIQSTTDQALLAFAKSKIQMFHDIAAVSADDCTALLSGKAAKNGTLVRIITAVPETTKEAVRQSQARLIEGAEGWETISDRKKSDARFDALYEKLDAKLQFKGSSAYFLADEKKSASDRCQSGIGIFDETIAFPDGDRSFMLRRLLSD